MYVLTSSLYFITRLNTQPTEDTVILILFFFKRKPIGVNVCEKKKNDTKGFLDKLYKSVSKG